MFYNHDHDYKNDMNKFVTKKITIGNNVWIGAKWKNEKKSFFYIEYR